MVERGYGKIINIGSDAGRVGEYQEAVYGACKGGVIALSKALARELGRYKVTVNVVCPGLTLPEKTEDAGSMSLWHSDSRRVRFFANQETLAKVVKRYPLAAPRRAGRHRSPGTVACVRSIFVHHRQIISVSGGYAM
jgi:2-hydroxycyclohexanecarboxyl-CoA dehydrogenase